MKLFNYRQSKIIAKEKPETIVNEIERKLENSEKLKEPYLKIWLIISALLMGVNQTKYDIVLKKLITPSEKVRKLKYIFNIIAPTVWDIMSRLLYIKYDVKVLPMSAQEEDIEISEVGNKLRTYFNMKLDTFDKQYDSAFFRTLFGTSFEKIFIEENSLSTASISPLEIFYSPGATNTQDGDWIIHSYIISTNEAKRRYPDFADEIEKNAGDRRTSNYWTDSILSLLVKNHGLYGLAVDKEDKTAKIIEYYEKPSKEYVKGRTIIIVNKIIVYESKEDNPVLLEIEKNKYFWNPFIDKKLIAIPGSPWGKTFLQELIGHQRWIDNYWNQMSRYLEKTCDPKRLDSQRTTIKESDTIIEYSGTAPTYLTPPSIPSYTFQLYRQVMETVKMISNFSPFAFSKPAATAFEVGLEEEKTARTISPFILRFLEQEKQSFMLKLLLIQKYYPSDIALQIVGEHQHVEIVKFKKSILKNYSIYLSVSEPEAIQSKLVKEDRVIKKAELGIYGSLAEPETRAKILSLLGEDRFADETITMNELDRSQARRENQEMENGIIPVPDEVDNHLLHIYAHQVDMKQAGYHKLPTEIKHIKTWHFLLHKAYLMQDETQRRNTVKSMIDLMILFKEGKIAALFDQYGFLNISPSVPETTPTEPLPKTQAIQNLT